MTDVQHHIEDLQHVYRECERSEDEIGDAPGIADTYNRVVEELHGKYPDKETIQHVETVQTASGARALKVNDGVVGRMKSRSRSLIRELGGEVPDVRSGSDESGGGTTVDVDVHTNQNQEMETTVEIDLDAVIETIDEEHVRGWAEEFRAEMETEDPDEEHLKDLYRRIFGYSKSVSASLVASAINRGIDLVA